MSMRGEAVELDALLQAIHQRYGYDFTHYSRASLRRRIYRMQQQQQFPTLAALADSLLQDENCFDQFLKIMSITVTELFRDPAFYRAVRQQIVPIFKTYPFVKIWHAGCASGEEVYSMAILLREEGFLDRAQIYATDFNKYALAQAQSGVYAAKYMDLYAENYAAAGGTASFVDYIHDGYEHAKFRDFLKERITFSYHNLVSDGVFGEMNLICCRNVLIYFDRVLQNRALTCFSDSLRHGGFLCLGSKETLNFTAVGAQFETIDARQKIYRKKGAVHEPARA